jgi:hypothetical protein
MSTIDDRRQHKRGPGGRPSGYDPEAHPEKAFRLALLGARDEDIAAVLEIGTSTLYRWQQGHPEFWEAIKRGKGEADADVAHSLYQKALGGDTTAMIFWLKCRQGWKEGSIPPPSEAKPKEGAEEVDIAAIAGKYRPEKPS